MQRNDRMQESQGSAVGHGFDGCGVDGATRVARWHGAVLGCVVAVLVGLGHPGSVPRAWAQSSPSPFDLIGDQAVVSLGGFLPAHDATVGRLAGEAGVSGGAASYGIPIVVPPGRRGMQPSLSLNYSSRSGNGIAGMGWSLSGLSSLHRCPWTLAQDGQIRAVQLDAQDRLCLDGQRLVATSGGYGASGTTYGTELESFVRVTQLGGDLTSTATYFKVERKSGEIAWYGNTSSAASPARVIPGGASVPLTWLVARVEDRVGNAMHYAYTAYGDGETLVSDIRYTGTLTTVGDRRVAFTYEDRPNSGGANDRSSSYLAGGVTRQTKRLSAVTTFVGSAPVRSLVLAYTLSTTTARSLLQSATDCAHDGTNWVCRPPTTFAWQQGVPSYGVKLANLPLEAAGGAVTNMHPVGDMDGDGATEVVFNGDTLVSLTPERTLRWSMAIPALYGWIELRQGSADFNQDGRVDFVARDATTGTLVVRSWSGSPGDTNFQTAFGTLFDTGIPMSGPTHRTDRLHHVGDMDGDGRADLVMTRSYGVEGGCGVKVHVYRNTPNGANPPTFPEVAVHCLSVPHIGDVIYTGEKLQGVSDFDGDGLPDLLIESNLDYWPTPIGAERGRRLDRILFGQKQGASYTLVNRPFATLFQSGHARTSHEAKTGLFTLWLDANGDGLNDWLYIGSDGKWKLRYNRGGVLGQMHNLNSSAGLVGCGDGSPTSQARCAEVWQPWQAPHLGGNDFDGDGRSELTFPVAFAANICVYKPVDTGACPGGDGVGLACWERWVCPEDPLTGALPPGGGGAGVTVDQDGDGVPETEIGQMAIGGRQYGFPDYSVYKLNALRIVEGANGVPVVQEVATGLLSDSVQMVPDDLYGDGHGDDLLLTSPRFGLRDQFGILTSRGGMPVSETVSPRSLPGGLPILSDNVFINENLGPGAQKNASDNLTPQTQDLLAMATDGFGQQTVWSYAPLAGKAGRTAGQLPLYTVPTTPAQRYIDEQHIYFTSSMPVVESLIRSDGLGGYRTWRYGYGEAMYHTQGRGFQGFRTIIEEDVSAGLRTTTTFHQKFPLTSQPERVVVNPISRSGEDGAISREQYTWRCDRSNRSNAAACVPTVGIPNRYFPFLDTKETWTYDGTTALGTGTPAVLGYTREIAAADNACAGPVSSVSGYDAHGNLTARTIEQFDQGSGSASGTANRLQRQCVSESSTFAPDVANWWLDRLSSKTASTQVTWDGTQHPLPAGTANPTRTVTSSYVWNADRTLSSETVQSGIANQQRVTAYTYPATNNYGLPTGVAVSASGDPHGTRSTGTSYTADGYFPLAVVNALNHSASTAVRARDGQPLLITDANGLRTSIEYDAFGFATRKTFRGASDAVMVAPDQRMSVVRCTLAFCWRPVEQYQMTTVQDGAPVQVTRHDALGRPTLTAELQQDEVWTHVFREYDPLGRLVYETTPFRGGDAIHQATFFYDGLGRMTQKRVPKQGEDGRGDLVTRYGYSGRTTTIQVCGSADSGTGNCLNLSRTQDSLGRYVETRDALNGRTRFWYEANGNVAAIEDANGVVTRASYNAIGQRTSVNDPNQGAWSFVYNALGEVTGQVDARGIATGMSYDVLGRPNARSASVDVTGDGVADTVADSWSYDPVNAKGAPATSQRTINGQLERSTTSTYDPLARPVQQTIVQALTSGTQTYTTRTKYDSYYGRPIGQEYPNGEAVQQVYGYWGHAIAERDPATGIEYRRSNSVNARGQATSESFGNGMTLSSSFQSQTGQLTGLTYATAAGPLRQLGYGYDVFGNVKRQSLNGGGSREDYAYDQLHRMVSAIRSGAASGTVSYGYDAVGNLKKKTDFSANTANAYGYSGGSCGGGPNAVQSVQLAAGGTRTYCYDANGNLISDSAGLAIQYDHQNLPTKATRGSQTDWFRYGPDGMRTRSWGADGARVYLPGYEHRTDTGETKVYVGDYAVISRTGSTRKVEYLLKDRLGSVDAVANASGSVIETRGYDAFGKPRDGAWNDLNPAKIASTTVTPKGFTQHEHLNQLELIHMNGRAYDYHLGRFTGVDPFIQFPLNSQSLNPYSYILNNPLSGTDPTGYACSTGTHIQGEAGPNCETTGATGGSPMSENPTQARALIRSLTVRDGDGGVKTTNMAVKTASDGTRSYTQVGATNTVDPPNGANGSKIDDPIAGDYADLQAKRDQLAGAAEGVKRFVGETMYGALDPCWGAKTPGGCTVPLIANAVGGKIFSLEVKGIGKIYGDARGVAYEGGKISDEGAEYVYRGVHKGHPAEVPARDGIVVPGNPYNDAVTPEAHNIGGVSADSPYTSWTRREDVARDYAGDNGVVLRVRTGSPPEGAGWSWQWSPDVYEESEVLMKGIREDVEVLP
jgi:RHS repeat-associated protein